MSTRKRSYKLPPDQRKNLDWANNVLPVAREIVASYDTQVTLRQLFYRLVSLPVGHPGRIPNKRTTYCNLSALTAEGRREGTFPDLIDQGRRVVVPAAWDSAREAVEELRDDYRRDRTEGQEFQIYLGVEKSGLVNLLDSWFGDQGLPILPLGRSGQPGLH
jgi:hypothetical protein